MTAAVRRGSSAVVRSMSLGGKDFGMSPKQLLSLSGSNARVNLWVGSIRAGKTISSLLRFLIQVAVAGFDGEIVITGRTRDSIYRNVISSLQNPKLFGAIAYKVKYNRGAPTAWILGRQVHIIGASDAKAEATIRGMTVLIWYCDEATVHPETFFTQMLGRMSPEEAKAFITTNPDAPRHWLKAKFIDRIGKRDRGTGRVALKDWKTWHFVLDDNPSLTREYVESIKAEMTGMWYDRYILGLWKMAEGAIWDSFDENVHVIKKLPEDVRILRRLVGVDYGTTNATAAILIGLGSDGKIYVLSEWRHNSRAGQGKWTDAQLSSGMRKWLESHKDTYGGSRIEWVAADPSAASFRLQLWRDGLSNVMEANNEVVSGVRRVASLFAINSLMILKGKAPGLVDEIPGYIWDSKAAEEGEDKVVKVNDHSCDGLRYAVSLAFSLWGNQMEVTYAAA